MIRKKATQANSMTPTAQRAKKPSRKISVEPTATQCAQAGSKNLNLKSKVQKISNCNTKQQWIFQM